MTGLERMKSPGVVFQREPQPVDRRLSPCLRDCGDYIQLFQA